jgi:thiamine phosphate phosphatase / amino-HMP aminohydrolase
MLAAGSFVTSQYPDPHQSCMAPKLLLLLDWDATLTLQDTLSSLVKIGYSSPPLQAATKDWTWLQNAYTNDYREHKAAYQPVSENSTTLDAELAWLSSLYPVEQASFCRAKDLRLFDGMTTGKFERQAAAAVTAGHVQLRKGWQTLFQKSNSRDSDIQAAIISVNWSATFIRACLLQAARMLEDNDSVLERRIANLAIYANEICPSCPGYQSTAHEPGIHTSVDKLRVLQQIRQPTNSHAVAYIGDSDTDLHCLLAADFGICVKSQSSLESTLHRVGISTRSLTAICPKQTGPKTIWTTSNLENIVHILTERALR